MSGFQSRVRDVINKAAPTYAVASVADRGLSYFLDPSMTGDTRFMQKAGYPFPLLTPQMFSTLAETATAGSNVAVVTGTRLSKWLIPGSIISFDFVEKVTVSSVSELSSGNLRITLQENILGDHVAGTGINIRGFVINPNEFSSAGAGGLGQPAVSMLSPFILVPGDVITVNGAKYTLSFAEEVSSDENGFIFLVKVTKDDGLPALTPSTDIVVTAAAAYRSQILSVPHTNDRLAIKGPVAIDWVSAPTVADYTPRPESTLFVEEFNAAFRSISAPRQMNKNDTLTKFSIERDQMLFWRMAEGGLNWNGTYTELKAFSSGRAHLWTPCRPPVDAVPFVTKEAVVTTFSPYAVLLLNNIRPDSVSIINGVTRAVIPSTEYSVNPTTGIISFNSSYASQKVVITYQPRLEWQLFVRPLADNIELTVTIGRESKQVFNLGAANTASNLTIQTFSSSDVDQIHVTARRADGTEGPFTVLLGDWTPRGTQTSAIRYTLITGATQDYNWASSGLLLKAMWPTIELLRARLDGDSLFSRYLDNGRMLI
jgi:hypothetical protein